MPPVHEFPLVATAVVRTEFVRPRANPVRHSTIPRYWPYTSRRLPLGRALATGAPRRGAWHRAAESIPTRAPNCLSSVAKWFALVGTRRRGRQSILGAIEIDSFRERIVPILSSLDGGGIPPLDPTQE